MKLLEVYALILTHFHHWYILQLKTTHSELAWNPVNPSVMGSGLWYFFNNSIIHTTCIAPYAKESVPHSLSPSLNASLWGWHICRQELSHTSMSVLAWKYIYWISLFLLGSSINLWSSKRASSINFQTDPLLRVIRNLLSSSHRIHLCYPGTSHFTLPCLLLFVSVHLIFIVATKQRQ